MKRLLACFSLCALAWLGGTSVVPAEEGKLLTHPLVTAREGALPIVLSAPHGGREKVPDVAERKGEGLEKGPAGYFTGQDTNTDLLAEALSAAIEARMGKKPYLVVARFARKYLDVNRPPHIAYESPAAKPVYDAYHDTLAAYCRAVEQAYGRGLLLDVHGQGSVRDTVFRGTKNGQTVRALIERFGEPAHNGPESLFGLLAAQGCTAHPTDGSKERSGLNGGYIVQTYGSHREHGLDAVQLEFGMEYRDREKIPAAAGKVAAAVEAYAKKYFPAEPQK